MKTLEFHGGDQMPILGLGTWKSDPGEVKHAVKEAIKIGYRHIDCAAAYGNEAEVGEAIAESIEEGVVKREELWITSKLWNDSHQKDAVRPAIENTLKDLQLDYLDLYLIHWPVALKRGTGMPEEAQDFIPLEEVPIIETWRAMEELRTDGLARHIGVSNFSHGKLVNLIPTTKYKPELNQVELHPYLQQPELVDYCQSQNIHLTAYSPLGSMDRPDDLKRENEPVPLESDTIKSIAKKHNCEPAQVLIAFAIARNTAVIPKSTSPEHLKSNFEAHKINLDQEDMQKIRKMDKGFRFVDGSAFDVDGNPYTKEEIWDEHTGPANLESRKEVAE